MNTPEIFVGNDNVIEVFGLSYQDQAGDTVYLDGTDSVQVTLLDQQGGDVAGQVWPLAISYVAGSNGDFRQSLLKEIQLQPSQYYTARVEVDGGPGIRGEWVLKLKGVERSA